MPSRKAVLICIYVLRECLHAMQAKALLEVKPQMDEAGVNLIALSVGEPSPSPSLMALSTCVAWLHDQRGNLPCKIHNLLLLLLCRSRSSTHRRRSLETLRVVTRCAREGPPVL